MMVVLNSKVNRTTSALARRIDSRIHRTKKERKAIDAMKNEVLVIACIYEAKRANAGPRSSTPASIATRHAA